MPSFQVDQFEAGEATGEIVALRLDGRWIAANPETVSGPVLLVRSGAALERFEPAPGTDVNLIATPAGEPWSAIFPVSAALIAGAEAGFALEVAGGLAFALPDPGAGPSATPVIASHGTPSVLPATPPQPVPTAAPPVAAPPVAAPPVAPPTGVEPVPSSDRADHEYVALQDAVRELQARLEAERRARRAAEDQLEQEMLGRERQQAAAPANVASSAFTDQLQDLEQRLDSLVKSNSELERRATDAEREAQTLQGALETTREAHAQARAAALAGEQRVAELQSGSTQAETTVTESRQRIADLEARASQSDRRAAELETELAEARRVSQETAARAQDLQARDEQLRQQAELAERRAEEASARVVETQAHTTDSRAEIDSAAQRAAEAERQLREASSEIATLRAAAENAHQRELQQSEARDTAQRQAGDLQAEVQALAARLQQAEALANNANLELDEAQRKLTQTDDALSAAPAPVAYAAPEAAPEVVQSPPRPIDIVPPAPPAPVEAQPAAPSSSPPPSMPAPPSFSEPEAAATTEEKPKRKSFRFEKRKPKNDSPAEPDAEKPKRKSFRFEKRKPKDDSPAGPGAAVEAPKRDKKEVSPEDARKQRSITMLLIALVVGGAFLAAKANELI